MWNVCVWRKSCSTPIFIFLTLLESNFVEQVLDTVTSRVEVRRIGRVPHQSWAGPEKHWAMGSPGPGDLCLWLLPQFFKSNILSCPLKNFEQHTHMRLYGFQHRVLGQLVATGHHLTCSFLSFLILFKAKGMHITVSGFSLLSLKHSFQIKRLFIRM